MIKNIGIHFLPVDECHTHALTRDIMDLRLDGQVCRLNPRYYSHQKNHLNNQGCSNGL